MSTITVATLPRISAVQLSKILLSSSSSSEPVSEKTSSSAPASISPQKLAIIDVRDDDHIGGHIKSSTHIPSSTLDHAIPTLVRTLQDKEIVVFHCALSQVRGPSAALRYLRERERLLGAGTGVGKKMMKSAAEEKGLEIDEDEGNEEEEVQQKVYVLEGGFVKWQEKFAQDQNLTEGWRKEIWEEGY